MGRIGMPELIVIAIVVLVLFGAKRLPEIGRAIGKAIKEFKKAGKEAQDSMNEDTDSDDQANLN